MLGLCFFSVPVLFVFMDNTNSVESSKDSSEDEALRRLVARFRVRAQASKEKSFDDAERHGYSGV